MPFLLHLIILHSPLNFSIINLKIIHKVKNCRIFIVQNYGLATHCFCRAFNRNGHATCLVRHTDSHWQRPGHSAWPLNDSSLARDVVIISRWYYANFIGYPSESMSSSMSGSPVAVRAGAPLLDRWLLPRVRQHSALSAVSWRSDLRGKHSAVATTELLQPLDLACGTLFRSSCAIHLQNVQTTAEGTPFSGSMNTVLWILICGALVKHSLIYLLLLLFNSI